MAVAGLPHGLTSIAEMTAHRSHDPVFALWPGDDMAAPLILLFCSWWYSAPGKGMLIQRIAASRDEKSAMLTVLTFTGLYYLVRPWAWYLIGAAGLIYLPQLAKPEAVFPELAAQLLPSGLFGLLVMAVALTFMASVNSRLNYGASLIVNDVVGAVRPDATPQTLKRVEFGTIVLLCLLAFGAGALWASAGIRSLYQFLTMMLSGTGFVAIARWYWSRTTIWGEIASLVSAIIVATSSTAWADTSRPADYALALGINFLIGAVVTIIAAYLGPSPDRAVATTFYNRVRPGGPGWPAEGGRSIERLGRLAGQWLLANGALFSIIYAMSKALAAEATAALAFSAFGLVSLVAMVVIGPRRSGGN